MELMIIDFSEQTLGQSYIDFKAAVGLLCVAGDPVMGFVTPPDNHGAVNGLMMVASTKVPLCVVYNAQSLNSIQTGQIATDFPTILVVTSQFGIFG
jgi:hypothetical protein